MDEHFEEIADRMRMGRWSRGDARRYAEEHGISYNAALSKQKAAAALVCGEVRDPHGSVVTLASRLQNLLEDCEQDGDRRNLLAAAHLLAKITGAMAPDKTELQVAEVTATPQEAARLMSERFRSTPEVPDDSNDG